MGNKYKLLIMMIILCLEIVAVIVFDIPIYVGFPAMLAINLYMTNSKWGRMDG